MLQIAPPRMEAPVQGIEIPTSAAGMGGIREVVAFLRRAQRIVALFAGVALSLGLTYLLFATPQFTATSVVLVDANKAPGFQQRPLSSDPISDAANIESQIEVVRSDSVALAVISRLKLADDPSFLPKPNLPRTKPKPRQSAAARRPRRTRITLLFLATRRLRRSWRRCWALARTGSMSGMS